MICEKCKKKKASVFYNESINGKTRSYSLCPECAAAMKKGSEIEDIGSTIGSFRGFPDRTASGFPVFPSVAPVKGITPLKACPVCGMTPAELTVQGRPGCAACFRSYSTEILGLAKRYGTFGTYDGKQPARFRVRRRREERIKALREQLKTAVGAEDFELAASVRDEIHTLEAEA